MTTTRHRTVFDLTPQELQELYQLNLNISATVPPRRPRSAPSCGNFHDRHFDDGIFERYQEMYARAKSQRVDWLRLHRITRKVMLQAIETNYNPYAKASKLGLVAPPEPEGYAEAQRAWREPKIKSKKALEPLVIGPLGIRIMTI